MGARNERAQVRCVGAVLVAIAGCAASSGAPASETSAGASEGAASVGDAGDVSGPGGADGPADTGGGTTTWPPADVGPARPPGPDVAPVRAPFTIVMVPDTQYTVQNWPGDYHAQMHWIVDQAAALDIRFVAHVGDLQETAHRVADWENAADGLDILQGVVPYSVAIGNHDFDAWALPGDHHANIAADRSTSKFNQYVPRSRMSSQYTYGGSLPADANDNGYHVFAAGGTDWLVLTLNYHPTADELAWGRSVVEAHPDRQVIVVTHEYLDRTGGPSGEGQAIWDGLVKLYPNISMVLSGHLTGENRRMATGDHGNAVLEILADFQSTDNRIANSYLRTMRFDPIAGTLHVQTYSPAYDEYLTGDEPVSCPPWDCPVTGGHEFTITDLSFPPAHAEWLTARTSGDCVDVAAASVANDGAIIAYACTGGENQQWRIDDAGDGFVHVVSRRSNKCLNVTGSSLDDGAAIIQWTCGPDANSTWRLEDVDGGFTRIVAKHSDKCLALADAPGPDGLLGLVQRTCDDADEAQHFLRTPF